MAEIWIYCYLVGVVIGITIGYLVWGHKWKK